MLNVVLIAFVILVFICLLAVLIGKSIRFGLHGIPTPMPTGCSPAAARYLREQVRRRGIAIEDLEEKLVTATTQTRNAFDAGFAAFQDSLGVWHFETFVHGPAQEAWEAYCAEKGWPCAR